MARRSHRLIPAAVCVVTLAAAPAAHAASPPASNDLVPALTFTAAHGGSPGSVDLAPNGHLLVAAPAPGLIDEYTTAGTLVDSYDGADSGTTFSAPQAVATDAEGNIYVADSGHGRIVELDDTGAFVAAFDGSASPGHQLSFPLGVAVHGSTVYVADGDRIETFTTGGTFQSAFGSSGSGNGQLNSPSGMDVAADGSVYVADRDNHRVEVFDADGSYNSQFGGTGGGAGQFEFPTDVSLDADGNVFVADSNNHRGQKLTTGGSFLGAFAPLAGPRFVIGVASDGNLGVWGSDQGTFTSGITHYAPRGEMTSVDGITSTSAALHGVVRPDGADVSYDFRWRPEGANTGRTLGGHDAGNGTVPVPVDGALTGLLADHHYVARLRIKPPGGYEISNDVTFTTDPAPAPAPGDITVHDITGLSATGATLNADITGHGGPSTVRVHYWNHEGPRHKVVMTTADPLSATIRHYHVALTGLQPDTHYTYTIALSNPAGGPVTTGNQGFTTQP